MTQARDKANIPVLNFASKGIDDNADATAITIDSSERVRINNTSSTGHGNIYNLIVGNESSGGDAGVLIVTPNNENSYLGFGDDGGVPASINYNHASNFLRTYVNGSERMRIASSGNVLIGSTINDSTDSNGQTIKGLVLSGNSGNGTYTYLRLLNRVENSTTTNGMSIAFDHAVTASAKIPLARITASPESSTNGNLQFFTGSSSSLSERMRIDSSGNVGIKNTTMASFSNLPATDLVVGAGSTASGITIYSSTSDGSNIAFADATSGDGRNQGIIQYHHNGDYMRFFTSAAERMRIDSSGNLLVGTTSQVFAGKMNLAYSRTSHDGFGINCDSTSIGIAIKFKNPNGAVGQISTSGSATTYSTSSDYRLKENVNYNFDATTRLKNLKPARFNFIADADTTVDGFIAHEVSSIVPEAITGTKDAVDEDGNPEYQGIDQSKLVPLLVKTIQELEARITALETNQP